MAEITDKEVKRIQLSSELGLVLAKTIEKFVKEHPSLSTAAVVQVLMEAAVAYNRYQLKREER